MKSLIHNATKLWLVLFKTYLLFQANNFQWLNMKFNASMVYKRKAIKLKTPKNTIQEKLNSIR